MIRSASWPLWPPVEFQERYLRNTRIPSVFEGAPYGIQWWSHDPLRSGEGFVRDLTNKMFIFGLLFKSQVFDGNGQVLHLGGRAETQGFPMVFEGPRGQPVRTCGMLDFTRGLMGKLV